MKAQRIRTKKLKGRLAAVGISNRETPAEEERERQAHPPVDPASPPPEDAGGAVGERDYSRHGRHTSHKAGSRSVAQKEAGSRVRGQVDAGYQKSGRRFCARKQGSHRSRPGGVVAPAARESRRFPADGPAPYFVSPYAVIRRLAGAARRWRSRTRERCVSMASVQSWR